MIAEQLAVQMKMFISGIKLDTPDDGRTISFEASLGDLVHKQDLTTALPLDGGVWREREGGYIKGSGVTLDGSWWIAQRQTKTRPGTIEGRDDWRLAVKRGQNGKDGKNGERGLQGIKGERGEPGPRAFGV